VLASCNGWDSLPGQLAVTLRSWVQAHGRSCPSGVPLLVSKLFRTAVRLGQSPVQLLVLHGFCAKRAWHGQQPFMRAWPWQQAFA